MWHFIFEAVPKDHDVLLAVLGHEGFHALEFPCRRSNDGRWIDVATGRSIADVPFMEGGRQQPPMPATEDLFA